MEHGGRSYGKPISMYDIGCLVLRKSLKYGSRFREFSGARWLIITFLGLEKLDSGNSSREFCGAYLGSHVEPKSGA